MAEVNSEVVAEPKDGHQLHDRDVFRGVLTTHIGGSDFTVIDHIKC